MFSFFYKQRPLHHNLFPAFQGSKTTSSLKGLLLYFTPSHRWEDFFSTEYIVSRAVRTPSKNKIQHLEKYPIRKTHVWMILQRRIEEKLVGVMDIDFYNEYVLVPSETEIEPKQHMHIPVS